MFIWMICVSVVLSYIVLLPVSIKWELSKRITLPVIGLIGIFSGLVLSVIQPYLEVDTPVILLIKLCIIGITSIALLLWRFYRDPDRKINPDPQNILSPADGQVIYIKSFSEGEIPYSVKNGSSYALSDYIQSDFANKGGILIGIAMTFLDVHVNRSPIAGTVSHLKKIPGLFLSLKKKEALIQNERAFIVIENENIQLGIVQISSRLVRSIVPYIKEGDQIERGQRIGMIRFGSQVDLLIPCESRTKLQVQIGDNVKAGESIIGIIE